MINSRHTGMIIWIIKILRRLHDTFYKQNALSLAFRQRVGVVAAYPKALYFQGLSGFFFINHFFTTAGAAVVFELYHTSFDLFCLCNILKDNNKACKK